jgi:hypothetical protein
MATALHTRNERVGGDRQGRGNRTRKALHEGQQNPSVLHPSHSITISVSHLHAHPPTGDDHLRDPECGVDPLRRWYPSLSPQYSGLSQQMATIGSATIES